MDRASDLHSPEVFASASLLAGAFADKLGQEIISGALRPGERLIETRLAEHYGISRSPVREGLRILANQGLVVVVERRGAMVKPLSPGDIEEAFACRMALQGLAAGLASERWQAPALAPLRHTLARMEQALRDGNVDAYFSGEVDYHEMICRLSGNRRLEHLLAGLGREMLRLRYMINTIEGRQHESLVYNQRIFAAIEARDRELAEQLTRELTWSGCRRLLERLSQLDDRP